MIVRSYNTWAIRNFRLTQSRATFSVRLNQCQITWMECVSHIWSCVNFIWNQFMPHESISMQIVVFRSTSFDRWIPVLCAYTLTFACWLHQWYLFIYLLCFALLFIHCVPDIFRFCICASSFMCKNAHFAQFCEKINKRTLLMSSAWVKNANAQFVWAHCVCVCLNMQAKQLSTIRRTHRWVRLLLLSHET